MSNTARIHTLVLMNKKIITKKENEWYVHITNRNGRTPTTPLKFKLYFYCIVERTEQIIYLRNSFLNVVLIRRMTNSDWHNTNAFERAARVTCLRNVTFIFFPKKKQSQVCGSWASVRLSKCVFQYVHIIQVAYRQRLWVCELRHFYCCIMYMLYVHIGSCCNVCCAMATYWMIIIAEDRAHKFAAEQGSTMWTCLVLERGIMIDIQ